ncbi:MAG: murein peptide amidase [Gaiellaceae bacterium]|nr:murein peptide amidase [Gaiellaceae bacterium]
MGRIARACVLATLALAASVWVPARFARSAVAGSRVVLLGRSLDGRPIRAVEVGDPAGTRVLVVGCIHGNECAGVAIAERLERTSPRGVDLWIVPVLNPDGRAADTRGNAHGVDLNRNFPWRWRRMTGFYESGARPLSEPEARIAYRLISRLRPHVTIWFHQHLDLVWASGGDRRIERRFARLSGLPYHGLPPLAGSAVSWQNHALPGTTAFAAELPAGELDRAAVARLAGAVLAIAH